MEIRSNENSHWAESLEDFKPNLTPVKVWNPLQCYQLIGRKTTLLLDNFQPIPELTYCYLSPAENRHYIKTFPDIPLWKMCYAEPDPVWDTFLKDFRQRVADKNVYMVLTPKMVKSISEMLVRVFKSQLTGEGKLDYRVYLELVDASLRYEDYKMNSKMLTGYKTVCNQFDLQLRDLWKKAYETKR
jgi:hypothetical protein